MQDITKLIKIGEKINLVILNGHDDHQHVSRVENINDDETIDVLIPISRNIILYIKNDTLLKFIIAKEGAIYEFKAKIVTKLFGVVPLLRLKRISEINKIQRRNYYRLKTIKSIKLRKIINLKEKQYDEYFDGSLVDISGGGIAFISAKELVFNDTLEMKLELNSNSITLFGKVVRVESKEETVSKKYSYGVNFEKITEIERNIIMRFIFEEQRRLAKKGMI